MAKKLIILDSGHSKATPGKRSPDSSLLEWDFNNQIQKKLKNGLEQLGFEVYLVNPNPQTGADKSLASRCNDANKYWNSKGKPDCLYISLHANAAGSGKWYTARGVETYTCPGCSSKSAKASKSICASIFKDVYAVDKGFKNRGPKTANFYVVKHTNMPSVLIEYGFYDNEEDIRILKYKKDLLCEATLKGICEYFGVAYKSPAVKSAATVVEETVQQPVNNNLPSTKKPWKNGTYNIQVKVTASPSLNVRAGRPGSNKYDNIIGVLPKNEIITVGYCLNGWFGVIINGKQGFISGNYVVLV